MIINKEYSAKGLVYGHLWGGYDGCYNSKTIYGETKKELLTKAKKGIMDGTLGTGDFQYLKGALLNVTTKATIVYEGIEFYRTDSEVIFVGDLTEKEQDFLLERFNTEF